MSDEPDADDIAHQASLVDRPRYCLTLDVDGTLFRFTLNKPPDDLTIAEREDLKNVARQLIAKGQH